MFLTAEIDNKIFAVHGCVYNGLNHVQDIIYTLPCKANNKN